MTALWSSTAVGTVDALQHCLHPHFPVDQAFNTHRSIFGTTTEPIHVNLEFAFSSIIKILLVRSGIETNPGPPTTTTTTWCCTASQQFNRVKRKITEVQGSFQSSVGRDTLTSAVIEIEESGAVHATFHESEGHCSITITIFNVHHHSESQIIFRCDN